jgi:hypothetical protein
VTTARERTRWDLESLNHNGIWNQGSSETVGKPAMITMIEAELVSPRDQASSEGFQNLKFESQGEITGGFDMADCMGKKGLLKGILQHRANFSFLQDM